MFWYHYFNSTRLKKLVHYKDHTIFKKYNELKLEKYIIKFHYNYKVHYKISLQLKSSFTLL